MGALLSSDDCDAEREKISNTSAEIPWDVSLNAFHTSSIKHFSPYLKQ